MAVPAKFNTDGVLDPGTHSATLAEVRASILVKGDGTSRTWDSVWREVLVNNAEILINQLRTLGVKDIFLDGSFVEYKDHPNDIDGYFDPHLSMMNPADLQAFDQLVSDLNNLDPHKVWTWDPKSRISFRGMGKKQLPMWHRYRVELYPHMDQGTGIKDAHGNDLQFPSAFRQTRHNFTPKGIIKIV
jgi:hypothetical protein